MSDESSPGQKDWNPRWAAAPWMPSPVGAAVWLVLAGLFVGGFAGTPGVSRRDSYYRFTGSPATTGFAGFSDSLRSQSDYSLQSRRAYYVPVTRSSSYGFALNCMVACAGTALVYGLDQIVCRRSFTLRTLILVTLTAALVCGLWAAARSHNAAFEQACHAALNDAIHEAVHTHRR